MHDTVSRSTKYGSYALPVPFGLFRRIGSDWIDPMHALAQKRYDRYSVTLTLSTNQSVRPLSFGSEVL